MPLAGAEGLIGQLVLLLIIAVIGWITKRSAEAEQRKRAEAPPPDAETEVSFPPPVAFPRPVPHAPPPPPQTSTSRPATESRTLVPARKRVVRSHLPHTSVAPALRVQSKSQGVASRRREFAFTRLGGGSPVPPGREAVRSGILWAEVLGPPRAHTGPHRSPVARRHAR